MKILFDDLRNFLNMDIIVRNYKSCIAILDNIDMSEHELFLDHDFGDQDDGKTGYDVTNYMLEINNLPKEITIVSANPVGLANIGRALEHSGYCKITPTVYKKQLTKNEI